MRPTDGIRRGPRSTARSRWPAQHCALAAARAALRARGVPRAAYGNRFRTQSRSRPTAPPAGADS